MDTAATSLRSELEKIVNKFYVEEKCNLPIAICVLPCKRIKLK